jgi:hypothetical protein
MHAYPDLQERLKTPNQSTKTAVTLTDKNSMRLFYIIFKKYYAIVNNLL